METRSMNVGLTAGNIPVLQELERSVKSIIAAGGTHALPVAGSALLVLGVLLSSGAETITSALISAALIFAGVAVLRCDNRRKGGAA